MFPRDNVRDAFGDARECAVCDVRLTRKQSALGFICDKPMCRWKYNTIASDKKCSVCSRELTVTQLAARVCDRVECTRVSTALRFEEFKRERSAECEAIGESLRASAAAEAGIENPEEFAVTFIPNHSRTTSELSDERKQKFREHLTHLVNEALEREEAVAKGSGLVRKPLPPVNEPPAPLAAVFRHACNACRGTCCTYGNEHAYITAETVSAYRKMHTAHAADEIVESYGAYLPSHSIDGGCVFQGETGCTLPAEMRSDTCNHFFCPTLKAFREIANSDPVPKAFLIPLNWTSYDRGIFAAPDFVQIVRRPLTSLDA